MNNQPQLSDITAVNNGAQFVNVDLHIHSYGGSHDVEDTSMTPTAIVDSAIRQGLGVIAITDHNSIANVQEAIEYARNNYVDNILVLAGVEVTTANGHLLAYFAPERIADADNFLYRIDLVGERGAENTRTAKSMADTILEAERFNGLCIAAHIDRGRTGFDTLAPGFPGWKRDIITSSGLYGLECDSVDALNWYSERDDQSSAGAERRKLLDARKDIPTLVPRHALAHLQGSDAHEMGQFERNAPGKSWTRLKLSEYSFSAVHTALKDPSARVRASAIVPGAIPRIRGMAITGGFLNGEVIHFSDNLNCLIGGRGTGKSTAIRALAYALGLLEQFEEFDNCPDAVTLFCEDENGTLFRYDRARFGDIAAYAKQGADAIAVSADAFRVEYFGQGELGKVAEDPLKNPQLLQAFLDRHTHLRDLVSTEESLLASLSENTGRLTPIEISFDQLSDKKDKLAAVDGKLKIAQEGNLQEIFSTEIKLASESSVRESIDAIVSEYERGLSLSAFEKDFDKIVNTAGACTEDEISNRCLDAVKATITQNNAAIRAKESELNAQLKSCGIALAASAGELKANDLRMSQELARKVADLKQRGLAATTNTGFQALLRERTSLVKEITLIEQRSDERRRCHTERTSLLDQLKAVRENMTRRRKDQLRGINNHLSETITDYRIFVNYDDAGISDEFESFMREKMHGSYLQDNMIKDLCSVITPMDLASLVQKKDAVGLEKRTGLSHEWAVKVISQLRRWSTIFELQALAKQPKPIITVRTKSVPPKEIPVVQLSDGQRHTILLTIAMLAESNVPLIIDQPEDDLDNAFVFSSIVTTLRAIKERRQVILVTHNANIAVLGDSELLLPLFREDDYGRIRDRGSIDTSATKRWVENILEGGAEAFLKRKEMYNH